MGAGMVMLFKDVGSPVMVDSRSLSCYFSNPDVLILTLSFRMQPQVEQEINIWVCCPDLNRWNYREWNYLLFRNLP